MQERISMMNITLLSDVKTLIQNARLCLADQNIITLYPKLFADHTTYPILAHESQKDINQFVNIQDWLLSHQVRRDERVLVIGGGITLDLAGFALATCLRGIKWQAVPTTLLAMVDASIGGKVGINTSFGKNTIGAFHPPEQTFTCLQFLESLAPIDQKNGISEMLKHLILTDPNLLSTICCDDLTSEPMIAQSQKIKQQMIGTDLNDHGKRQLLNLGHTYAHAIESASQFQVPHGIAVAMGLLVEGHILEQNTDILPYTKLLAAKLKELQFDLAFDWSFHELRSFMHQDKKNRSHIMISSPSSSHYLYRPSDEQWELAIKETSDLWHYIQPSNI